MAGVNLMTMDFAAPESDMGSAVRASLDAAHIQLLALYQRYAKGITSSTVWNRMGATMMIGQNDTEGEIFTLADAQSTFSYATSRQLGRISIWSLNRDHQCGSSFAEVSVHSNTCSGTPQGDLQFSKVFSGFSGSATASIVAPSAPATTVPVVDNPATSPYPVWQATRPYVTSYKVVRLGNVYQAKWFTQGSDPAAPGSVSTPSLWQLIGPVLAGEHPAPTTTLPAGTYPLWSPQPAYTTGAKVLYNGLPYQAKWYNQANSPGAEDAVPTSSPWQPLFTVPGEPIGG